MYTRGIMNDKNSIADLSQLRKIELLIEYSHLFGEDNLEYKLLDYLPTSHEMNISWLLKALKTSYLKLNRTIRKLYEKGYVAKRKGFVRLNLECKVARDMQAQYEYNNYLDVNNQSRINAHHDLRKVAYKTKESLGFYSSNKSLNDFENNKVI